MIKRSYILASLAACLVVVSLAVAVPLALARGGGGGSHGHSGGSFGSGSFHSGGFSGGYHSSYSSGYSSSSSATASGWFANLIGFILSFGTILVFFIGLIASFFSKGLTGSWPNFSGLFKQNDKIDALKAEQRPEPWWQAEALLARADEVFMGFQTAWSAFDADAFKPLLSTDYDKRVLLELEVLRREKRRNAMSEFRVMQKTLLSYHIDPEEEKNTFRLRIDAQAQDSLVDTDKNQILYTDNSSFAEYWTFKREAGAWKLNLIEQATEEASSRDAAVENFAKQHGFFYDPDFGWLMLPNKGVLFQRSGFKTADINNHVIGVFRKTIVEFYSYIASANAPTFLVAQAILPVEYRNILFCRRHLLSHAPAGLREIQLESAEFNRKFCLYAEPQDQINALVLLTPDFMERLAVLPFEVTLELVGPFAYLYAKETDAVDMEQMLAVLTWAFDSMKLG